MTVLLTQLPTATAVNDSDWLHVNVGGVDKKLSRLLLITGLYRAGGTDVSVADGGTGASTASGARSNLGLGSMAVQSATGVAITGGFVGGITDLAVADGGTGASTASAARANLAAQQSNVNLTGLAGLTSAADRLAYFTATGGAMALATMTSFARTLLTATNAATARTTLAISDVSPSTFLFYSQL